MYANHPPALCVHCGCQDIHPDCFTQHDKAIHQSDFLAFVLPEYFTTNFIPLKEALVQSVKDADELSQIRVSCGDLFPNRVRIQRSCGLHKVPGRRVRGRWRGRGPDDLPEPPMSRRVLVRTWRGGARFLQKGYIKFRR